MPRVINIASRLGTRPIEDSIAYCTCEAALCLQNVVLWSYQNVILK